MNIILFDDPTIRINLLPLTLTRPVADMRVGILTVAEKWEHHFKIKPSYATVNYLSKKFVKKTTPDNLWINGAICPDSSLVESIQRLKPGESLKRNTAVIAIRSGETELPALTGNTTEYSGEITVIDNLWKIFQKNGQEIRSDFKLITDGRKSAEITDPHTHTYNRSNIFIEEGVVLHTAVLNAEGGPIYLGKNSQVQEGAIIRGPFSLGESSVINMGAKMRGDTTIGPFSKIGGEVSNTVVLGYSNKAHDGFLGNSVLGEWCNLGADTNTSNLKNNYDNVKLWNYGKKGFADTGLPFCGLIMGDHSKSGINMMFNTGTVVGVSSSIFGAGYPRNFVPSYSWGGAAGFTTYQFDKAMETAERVMARRNVLLSQQDREILKNVFDQTFQ
ncbi:glucose-1-phosphate thymidylyltransferase [Cytophagales bacterium WSM2-2]|nr:glucose-1-phosphate thymidylyltransferase [Cytophagales bacterium WSM2-2]